MPPLPNNSRPTQLEVNLESIAHNLRLLQKAASPATCWPVVKANAYGHGLVRVSEELVRLGVDGLCVATYEEGLVVRELARDTPILVLGGAFGAQRADAHDRNLICATRDIEDLRSWSQVEKKRIALKLDCGMHRLGIAARDTTEVARWVQPEEVSMLITHLPSNEVLAEDHRTQEQLDAFDAAFARLVRLGACADNTPRSALNSAGCVRNTLYDYDIVRPGLALYGMAPGPEEDALRPAARLVSTIAALREIEPGERVGYEGTFTAARRTRVAAVPIGYGDGYLRANSNRAQVLVRGRRAPLIGRVSMDQITIDVTDIDGVARGDEVVLLGQQGAARIDADELGAWAQTISYEVTTQISGRVPRVYEPNLVVAP